RVLFRSYPRDNPLGAAPGRCAAGALPSFRTPKETRAGKGTCNLLAPPPRGGSTPVPPLTVRPLGGVADACFVCESRGRWNLPNGRPLSFWCPSRPRAGHVARICAIQCDEARTYATKRDDVRRRAIDRRFARRSRKIA